MPGRCGPSASIRPTRSERRTASAPTPRCRAGSPPRSSACEPPASTSTPRSAICQMADRGGEHIALHGGTGSEGVTNVVGFGANDTTTETAVERGERIEGSRSLTTLGYPVSNGTSFIFDVEYTADGPVAEALLTYGGERRPDGPVLRRPDRDVRGQAVAPDPVHTRRDRRRSRPPRVHDQRVATANAAGQCVGSRASLPAWQAS